ncbi:MAG: dihydrodipicolinate synthase family protein [Haloplanus sp.]
MGYDAVKAGLRDVSAGLLTPFQENSDIDHEALAGNAVELYDRGIRTFLANANISEYHSLSQSERVAVTRTSVDALPDDATVLAGVGGSTSDAIDMVEAFDDIGVDAMMVMPPDHTYVHERGLLSYYRDLGDAAAAPLVPYVRGFDPSVEFLADLTYLDDVVGVKYALEDLPKFTEAVGEGDESVVWVDGMAEPYALPLWVAGAEGFTAGVSNFRPRIGLALYRALEREDWERAREIQRACQPLMDMRQESGTDNTLPAAISVPVVKAAMRLAGFDAGGVRDPIVGLTEAEQERVERLYEDLVAFETEAPQRTEASQQS